MKTKNLERYGYSIEYTNDYLAVIFKGEDQVISIYNQHQDKLEVEALDNDELYIGGEDSKTMRLFIFDQYIKYIIDGNFVDINLEALPTLEKPVSFKTKSNTRLTVIAYRNMFEIETYDNSSVIFQAASPNTNVIMYDNSSIFMEAVGLTLPNKKLNVLAYDNALVDIRDLVTQESQLKVGLTASLYDNAVLRVNKHSKEFGELNFHDNAKIVKVD